GAVGALWMAGQWVARSHGALSFARGTGIGAASGLPFGPLGDVLARSALAELDLEDVHGGARVAILAGFGLLVALGLLSWVKAREKRSPAATERLSELRGATGLWGALAWWLVGTAPLAFLLPDWNSWRTTLPGLWLGLPILGFLGLARPGLA